MNEVNTFGFYLSDYIMMGHPWQAENRNLLIKLVSVIDVTPKLLIERKAFVLPAA